jgi:hypothetical protein
LPQDGWNDPGNSQWWAADPNAPYGTRPGQTPPPGQTGGPDLSAPKAASGASGPGALPPPGPGDISLDSITLGNDGHLYGERRIISGDPINNPGTSRYDFESVDLGSAADTDTTTRPNLTALAARWGINPAAITQKLLELQVQNAQTKANGYGKLISVNPDGSYTYQDTSGTRQTTNDPAALAAVGITAGDIAQEKAQAGESQRTLTQMGQYSVAGMNPDGSMQVRDYNGTLSTVTAQQAASGQIPGVSYADFQKAQADFVSNQKTLNQAGQYEATTANPDGSIQVRDGEGRTFNVSAQQAQGLPGIASGQIQYLQQQASDRNFLSGNVQAGGVYTPPTAANTPWVTLPGSGLAPPSGFLGPPIPGSPQGGSMAGNTPVNFSGGPSGVATQQGSGGLPGSQMPPQQQPPQQSPPQNFMGPPTAQGYGSGIRPQGGPTGVATGQGGPITSPTAQYGQAQVSTATGGGNPYNLGAGQGGYGQQPPQGGPGAIGQGGQIVPSPTAQGGQNFLGPPQQQGYGTGVRPQGGPLGVPTAAQQATYGAYSAGGGPTGVATQQGGAGGQNFMGPPTAQGGAPPPNEARWQGGGGGGANFMGPPTQQGGGGAGGYLGPPAQQGGGGGGGGGYVPPPDQRPPNPGDIYGNTSGYGYSANGFQGSQQDLQQQNQALQNYYQYGQNQFNNVHQAQDQQNTAYRYNQLQTQDQNAGMSRNMGGMGWAGLGRPTVAGMS